MLFRSPDPPAERPMAVLELVQLYVVPGTFPENWTGVASVFWHKTWFAIALTVGMGLTVMVNNVGMPWHEGPEFVNDGVTVIVAV